MGQLFSYKMKTDSGCAPNPFHGIMTLALCKAGIREAKGIGDYVAGFTSNELCGHRVGGEKLVFIMRITNILTFDSYYKSADFAIKKPSANTAITKAGDNIYVSSKCFKHGYSRDKNWCHCDDEHMISDLMSKKVLLSSDFYYFGCRAVSVERFNINVPTGVSKNGVATQSFDSLLIFLEQFTKNKVLYPPHRWPPAAPY